MNASQIVKWLRDTNPDPTPDAALLNRHFNGDTTAMELIIRRHANTVWTVCQRVAGNEQDAEDAFQATFVGLTQQARRIRQRASLGAWLYRVAFHASLRAKMRRERFRQEDQDGWQVTEKQECMSDPETITVLHDEISKLSEQYRLPVVLCDIEGRTRKEAAQLLGWKSGTVAGRLFRARKQLRTRLIRRGYSLGIVSNTAAVQSASAMLIRNTLVTLHSQVLSLGIRDLTQGLMFTSLFVSWKSTLMFAPALTLLIAVGTGSCWHLIQREQDTKVNSSTVSRMEDTQQPDPAKPVKVSFWDRLRTDYGKPAFQYEAMDAVKLGGKILNKKITVRGEVTKIDVTNPKHCLVIMKPGITFDFLEFKVAAEACKVGETVLIDGVLKRHDKGEILLAPSFTRDPNAPFTPVRGDETKKADK